jgi:hypothetical protein
MEIEEEAVGRKRMRLTSESGSGSSSGQGNNDPAQADLFVWLESGDPAFEESALAAFRTATATSPPRPQHQNIHFQVFFKFLYSIIKNEI